jgi:GNAT superfamily N-acetyltransferase
MKHEIRPIRQSDLKELGRVYVASYQNVDNGEQWTPESATKLLDDWLKKQPDLAYLAEVDKKIAGGFVVGVKPWWDGNHLTDGEIFVDPDYQKYGVGTQLLKHVFETAISKYDVVAWDTFTYTDTSHPLSWYTKLGFDRINNWAMITCNPKEVLKKLNAPK